MQLLSVSEFVRPTVWVSPELVRFSTWPLFCPHQHLWNNWRDFVVVKKLGCGNLQAQHKVATISDCFTAQAQCPRQNTGGGWPWPAPPRGQLQITLEHHHPAPAQQILHRGRRLVVSGHSQSLQLTGLGKPFPLICQKQPRLNYKKKVYTAHTKGTPRVPSLGDTGGCTTGPYSTPTTWDHTTNTRSQSSST